MGTGIRIIGQLTTESIAWIKQAHAVPYLVYDPLAGGIIEGMNPKARSLSQFYVEGKPRRQCLEAMVRHILTLVQSKSPTCLALLGHPGVFSWLGHEAVRQARAAGFRAKMLPAISAIDCLFADLGIDPGTSGCQCHEAMDFLNSDRAFDPGSLLILWQVGVIGDLSYRRGGYDSSRLAQLVTRLIKIYGTDHEAIVYQASIRLDDEPLVERHRLENLTKVQISPMATLCIPPRASH